MTNLEDIKKELRSNSELASLIIMSKAVAEMLMQTIGNHPKLPTALRVVASSLEQFPITPEGIFEIAKTELAFKSVKNVA